MPTSASPPPMLGAETALFLDVDGTLLELAVRPDQVQLPDNALTLLARLHDHLGGALALVSGRSIRMLDELFAPLRLAAAGLHGLERRDAGGIVHRTPVESATLNPARVALTAFARSHPGAVMEDKEVTVALHYRNVPDCEGEAVRTITRLLQDLGDAFEVQRGKMVLEIRPAGANKGDVIAAFLAERPFTGRDPVFVGDDVTDETGFRTVNARGGTSVRVGFGVATEATFCVRDVSSLYEWLTALAAFDS